MQDKIKNNISCVKKIRRSSIKKEQNFKNDVNKAFIEIENLNKYYGKKHILKNINLKINKGDKISLIGGNGSGKTTLVEIIAGLREKTSGEIHMNGDVVIGIQFQESNYPIGVTVKNLIDFYINEFEDRKSTMKLDELIKIFRLEKLLKKQIFYLSGGQKQRLNIFLAIVHNPNVLILDELSTGLDIKIKADLENYIHDYLLKNPDITLILITHTIGEIQQLTNRVIVLNWGVIEADLPVQEVIQKHGSIENYVTNLFTNVYKASDDADALEASY